MTDDGMKVCQACGRENAVGAGVCAFCGERFVRSGYEASVEAGLRRLESEKLKFLSTGSVFSKFDPETVAAFEPQIPPHERDANDAMHDDFLRDAILSDDIDLDKTTAFDKGTSSDLSVQSVATVTDVEDPDSEDASAVFVAGDCISHDSLSDSEIREAVLDDSPSEIIKQSSFSTLNFAAIRNFSLSDMGIPSESSMDTESSMAAETGHVADHDDLEGEETHAIASDAVPVTIAEMCQSLGSDVPPPPPPPLLGMQRGPKDDSAVQEISFDGVEVVDPHDHSEKALELVDDDVEQFDETLDHSDKALELVDDDVEQFDDIGVRYDGDSAQDGDSASTLDTGATAARVRAELKAQQAAKTVRADAIEEIQTHELQAPSADIARAKILKYATSAPRGDINAGGEDSDSAITAIEKLKQIGVFEPVRHAEVNRSISSARAQNAIDDIDQIIPPSKVEFDANPSSEINAVASQDVLSIPESDIASTAFDDDNEDKTYNQSPDAIDEIKYAAMLASAAKEVKAKTEHEPEVLPTSGVFDLDLDNRETMPIDVAPDLDMLKTAHSKARRKTEVDLPAAQEAMANEGESTTVSALWIVLIVVLLGLIGVLLYLMGVFSFISPSLAPSATPIQVKIQSEAVEPTPLAIRQSIARASFQMQMITDPDVWLDGWVEQKISTLGARERQPILSMARDIHPKEWMHWKPSIEDAISMGNFESARDMLYDARQTADMSAEQLVEWNALFYRSFAEDSHFIQPAQAITEKDCDEIAPLGGGSTVTLKLRSHGTNIAAFKPHQTRLQSNYRAEIAAWRLCELLDCAFEVPWNREVKVEKAVFYKLYDRSKSSKKEAYRKDLKDLSWQTSDGKTYVYGTLKDWVAKFTRFPIEYESLWKPWLSQSNFVESFPPLRDGLKPLRTLPHTKKLYDDILALAPNLDTKTLARQISEVLTFDFLIGNWDRYSGVKTWWGVNCQFANDKIVSIDNGASFPAYSNENVRDRFMKSERFSAHFITRLRMLDKDETKKLLFPNATEFEEKRFEQFWSQRVAVLERIDKLSEEYGVERVLSFD